jgi:hypothetical protein
MNKKDTPQQQRRRVDQAWQVRLARNRTAIKGERKPYVHYPCKGTGYLKPWKCPLCKELTTSHPATSRISPYQKICSDCGVLESLRSFAESQPEDYVNNIDDL